MPNVFVCVYVYDARILCYARCVPISFVGSSRNQVASKRGRREGGGVHRRGVPPIEAISKSTKYTAEEPASEQTPSGSLVSSIEVYLSLPLSLRRAILHLRLGLLSLDRSVSNLDTLLPEISPLVPPRIAS